MRSFFKSFFAALLALIVFSLLIVFLFIGVMGAIASKETTEVAAKSVLTIDLDRSFSEKAKKNSLGVVSGETATPGLYDVVRMIRKAANDKHISGIYIEANGNRNGFAASEELRAALIEFRKSKKFVYAYADVLSQKAYHVASVADRVYINPVGMMEWSGLSVELVFFKKTLDRLNIQPQIFYAGKFKSATEPLRSDRMTPENKLQTTEWLGSLYAHFLEAVGSSRRIDTASLRKLANLGAVQQPEDAVRYKLVDALKYDDEVKDEIRQKLSIKKDDKINFIDIDKYAHAGSFRESGDSRIALIYAEGNIIDGNGDKESIGGDQYVKLVRRARMDKSIKAIVLRVNSGGGSALASEKIWRELSLCKGVKPVVASFGDVAASGGYYIGCGADAIFAEPSTITGSIGVFGVLPNMQGFFNDKLGVTFDGVKTGPYADAGAVYRPLTEQEKVMIQQGVDRIYLQFKQRVAQGRKKDIVYIDSIAQGRVWSGSDAKRLGLVDQMGTLGDAIKHAAKLAKVEKYRLRETPESENWIDEILQRGREQPEMHLRSSMGEDNYRVFRQLVSLQQICNTPQARLPFEYMVR